MKVGSHFLPSASKSFEYACRNGFMPAILSSLITLRRRVSRLTDRISSFFSSTLEFQSFFFLLLLSLYRGIGRNCNERASWDSCPLWSLSLAHFHLWSCYSALCAIWHAGTVPFWPLCQLQGISKGGDSALSLLWVGNFTTCRIVWGALKTTGELSSVIL